MKEFSWANHEWRSRPAWGEVHPNLSWSWYDESQIEKINENEIILKSNLNPKTIKDWYDGTVYNSTIGFGHMESLEAFEYGRFEVDIKLPKGKYLWPAFWFVGGNSWPPEFDVFEAFTENKNCYFHIDKKKWWHFFTGKWWRVESNIHLGKNADEARALGAKRHFLGLRSPIKKYYNYAIEWREDSIKIFYNNRCVRKITDESVLSELRGETMRVIISTGVKEKHLEHITETKMYAKNFKYTKF